MSSECLQRRVASPYRPTSWVISVWALLAKEEACPCSCLPWKPQLLDLIPLPHPPDPCLWPRVQRPPTCWGTTRRSRARSPRASAARVTPVPTTTTARTGGGAPGNINTGLLAQAGRPRAVGLLPLCARAGGEASLGIPGWPGTRGGGYSGWLNDREPAGIHVK